MLREADDRAAVLPALLRRVVRYGFVGGGVSVFYSMAVVACVVLLEPIRPTTASIIAFAITLPIAYVAHACISFSDRAYDKFQPLRFVVSTAASFMIAIGGMYWVTEVAGLNYLFGILWNWLIIPAMNLSTYLFWVFRSARKPGGSN